MTSTLEASTSSSLLGSQVPTFELAPEGVGSLGPGAVELARRARVSLFPWQDRVLDRSMRVDAAGRFVCPEVALIVSRQNGKGEVLLARCLYGLFVLGENIFHSAHEFKTAADAYRRIKAVIQSTPALHRRVVRYNNSHGQEGIELDTGNRLMFIARTAGSGRGFSKIDLLIMDEAYNLSDHSMGALVFTQNASVNPQIIYASSAVDIDVHPNGYVLSGVRRSAVEGEAGLYLAEWAAPPELDRMDPVAWTSSNPSLGLIPGFDRAKMESNARKLCKTSVGEHTFDVETLSRGVWAKDVDEAPEYAVDPADWAPFEDLAPDLVDDFAIAFDMPPDRSVVSIVAATRRTAGGAHYEVIAHGKSRDGVDLLVRVHRNQRPRSWCVARSSPAMSIVPDLEAAGIEVTLVNDSQLAQTCGALVDELEAGQLSHTGDSLFDDALRSARKRDAGAGGAWTWDRKGDAVISPIVAATLARFGLWAEVDEPQPLSVYETEDFVML